MIISDRFGEHLRRHSSFRTLACDNLLVVCAVARNTATGIDRELDPIESDQIRSHALIVFGRMAMIELTSRTIVLVDIHRIVGDINYCYRAPHGCLPITIHQFACGSRMCCQPFGRRVIEKLLLPLPLQARGEKRYTFRFRST